MKINDLKTFIKGCAEKQLHVPILMVGSMGVGKSQIMAQAAKELEGFGLIDLRLAQQESGDLIGLPYKNGDNSTHWAKPEWWPKEGTKGILFLDEINRAPNDVRQAVFQLVLDRKLHTHVLPEGWYVGAAMNPDNGNYQVEQLDRAMTRRFCTVKVEADVDTWLAWGKQHLNNNITEFINTNRKLLFVEEKFNIEIVPNPDAYRMLNLLIEAKVIPPGNQAEIFGGLIGETATVALIKWMDTNYTKPISGTQILQEFEAHKAKVKAQRNDENYVTITDLAAILADPKNLPKVNSAEYTNLCNYTLALSKESRTSLISKLSTKAREVILQNGEIAKLLLETIG